MAKYLLTSAQAAELFFRVAYKHHQTKNDLKIDYTDIEDYDIQLSLSHIYMSKVECMQVSKDVFNLKKSVRNSKIKSAPSTSLFYMLSLQIRQGYPTIIESHTLHKYIEYLNFTYVINPDQLLLYKESKLPISKTEWILFYFKKSNNENKIGAAKIKLNVFNKTELHVEDRYYEGEWSLIKNDTYLSINAKEVPSGNTLQIVMSMGMSQNPELMVGQYTLISTSRLISGALVMRRNDKNNANIANLENDASPEVKGYLIQKYFKTPTEISTEKMFQNWFKNRSKEHL